MIARLSLWAFNSIRTFRTSKLENRWHVQVAFHRSNCVTFHMIIYVKGPSTACGTVSDTNRYAWYCICNLQQGQTHFIIEYSQGISRASKVKWRMMQLVRGKTLSSHVLQASMAYPQLPFLPHNGIECNRRNMSYSFHHMGRIFSTWLSDAKNQVALFGDHFLHWLSFPPSTTLSPLEKGSLAMIPCTNDSQQCQDNFQQPIALMPWFLSYPTKRSAWVEAYGCTVEQMPCLIMID